MDKLIGWGEKEEEGSSHQEGIQDWLLNKTAESNQASTGSTSIVGKSRIELDTEKWLEKQHGMEKEKKEKKKKEKEMEPPTFVFRKKGKITEEESIELKRTHNDILKWVKSARRAGIENEEQESFKEQKTLNKELRLEQIRRKMTAWDTLRLCRNLAKDIIETSLSQLCNIQPELMHECEPELMPGHPLDLMPGRAEQQTGEGEQMGMGGHVTYMVGGRPLNK